MKRTLAFGVLLAACVGAQAIAGGPKIKTIEVTYITDIAGATLYEETRPWGLTPMTLKYKLGEGCTGVKPLTVRWPSGAEASVQALTICTATAKRQQFTFNRPVGYPGREVDVQFALQLAQVALQRQQVDAAYWLALSQSLRVTPPLKPINCTSQVIGNQIFTNCF